MQGADVRKAREAIGWKRPELATRTGLSVAQIASIETGRSIRPAEETVLRDVLQERLEQALVGNGKVPATSGPDPMPPAPQDPAFDPGVKVLEEWCGLVKGDEVRITGDVKPLRRYVFLRYVEKPEQTIVELGPVPGKGATGRIINPNQTVLLIKRKNTWREVNSSAVQDA